MASTIVYGQSTTKDIEQDTGTISALKIGDTIPEGIWTMPIPLLNHPDNKSTTSLKEMSKSKLIILDFWATWCSSCITGFAKVEDVQRKFGGQVDVLLVNTVRTKDDKAKVDKVLGRYKEEYGFVTGLPYTLKDTVFQESFPHRGLPHVVWITNDRVVRAVSYSTQVNAQNVQQILDGDKPTFHIKDDFKYFADVPQPDDTLSLIHSYLTKRREGIRETGLRVKEQEDKVVYSFLNVTIGSMLQELFGQKGYNFPWDKWVFDSDIPAETARKIKSPLQFTDDYCYWLYLAKGMEDVDSYRIIEDDLGNYLNIAWEIKKEMKEVYVISADSIPAKYRYKIGLQLDGLSPDDKPKYFQKGYARAVYDWIARRQSKPFELEYVVEGDIDVQFPLDFDTYTESQIIDLLRELGAKVTLEKRMVEYVHFFKRNKKDK